MFYLDSFAVYKSFFISNNQVIACPELWSTVEWDNECYKNKHLGDYAHSPFTCSKYPETDMVIKDTKFFELSKSCGFYTIFQSLPYIKSMERGMENSPLYDKILDQLVHIGWNAMSDSGSAMVEGIYPAYLENGLDGKLHFNNEDFNITLNQFGLISTIKECEQICRVNNSHLSNQDFWYPVKLYVDQYTYSVISQYKPDINRYKLWD